MRWLFFKFLAVFLIFGVICCKLVIDEWIVYGNFLIDRDIIKMKVVFVIIRNLFLNRLVLKEEMKVIFRMVFGII